MSSSLKQQTISGVLWSALQKFGTMGVALISNFVLARLLSPDDYGCIGILAIFIIVANTFVVGGFAGALVQKKEPTDEDYSTVFYWNVVVAVLLYVGLYFSAKYIAAFYKISLLQPVLKVQGVVLVINALSVVQLNKLRKELNFKSMSVVQLVATVVSVVVAVVMACYGYGVWSLVAQQLVVSFITTALLWYVSPWRPVLCFSLKSFKALFAYGAFLLFSDLLNSICENIQGLIIGRRYSVADMGFYSQARKMEEVPTITISHVVATVTFPVFAKLQNDKERLYWAVRRSLRLMNFVNFPLMILLMVVAEPLFIILFSDKWVDSVPYFRILCVAGLVNCLQSVNYQVTAAVGRSKALFRWNIVKRVVGLLLLFVGMYWGVEGVLWAVVAGFYFTFFVNALVASTSTGYSLWEQVKDFLPFLFLSLVAALFAVFSLFVCSCSYMLQLLLPSVVYALVYLFVAKIIKLPELYELMKIVRPYIKIKIQ